MMQSERFSEEVKSLLEASQQQAVMNYTKRWEPSISCQP